MKRNKGFNYFLVLEQQSERVARMSELLHDSIKSSNKRGNDIKNKEFSEVFQKVSTDRALLTEKLMKEFLPPIEREDLYQLSNGLYEYSYMLWKAERALKESTTLLSKCDTIKLSELLQKGAILLHKVFIDLENFKKSKDLYNYLFEIRLIGDNMEKESDILMKQIEKISNDRLDYIKLSRLIESYLDSKNKLIQAINAVELMIMKNS